MPLRDLVKIRAIISAWQPAGTPSKVTGPSHAHGHVLPCISVEFTCPSRGCEAMPTGKQLVCEHGNDSSSASLIYPRVFYQACADIMAPDGQGFVYGQINSLKLSVSARSRPRYMATSLNLQESSGRPSFTISRSAKELRRSSQYDGTALSCLIADTECSFGRYASDLTWCIGNRDDATALTPLDKVGRHYTPTACALTMMQARAIASTSERNHSIDSLSSVSRGIVFKNSDPESRRLITAPAAWSACFMERSDKRCSSTSSARVVSPTSSPSHQRTDLVQTMIDNKIHCGALQVGGGAHQPLAEMDDHTTGAIVRGMLIAGDDNVLLKDMVDTVRWRYKRAVAHATVEYEMLQQHLPFKLGSEPKDEIHRSSFPDGADSSAAAAGDAANSALQAAHSAAASAAGVVCEKPLSLPTLQLRVYPNIRSNVDWTDPKFCRSSWRVQRQTGVPRGCLRFAYAKLEEGLCVIEHVQAELQHLWLLGALDPRPQAPDGNIKSMCPDVSPLMQAREKLMSFISSRGAIEPSTLKIHSYCEILLTDVGSSDFCKRLPMSLGAFSAHIAARAASALDVLQTVWLIQASGLLNDSMPCPVELLKQKSALSTESGSATIFGSTSRYDHGVSKQLKAHRIELESLPSGILRSSEKATKVEHTPARAKEVNTKWPLFVNTYKTAMVLMSRQLRTLCEDSLRAFAAFFRSFELPASSGLSVFQLDLLLNGATNRCLDGHEKCDIVRLDPSLADLQVQADMAIDCLVASVRALPQPANSKQPNDRLGVCKPTLHVCGVALDDELVSQTRTCVHRALSHHFSAPLKLVARFAPFRSLLDGTVDTEVRSEVCARTRSGGDTTGSLDRLTRLCLRLVELGTSVRATTENVVHRPLFSVTSLDCKAQLVCITDSLRHLVAESVAADNHSHMVSICGEYSEVVEHLQMEPVDCNELRALQEYSTRCIDTLTRLVDEYSGQVHERVQFLLSQTQHDCARASLSRDDAAILVTTCQWPAAVRQSMAHSQEVQQTRKRQLEMLVEGQQEALSREATNLEKKIEKIAEAGSLAPTEVQAIYKRIVGVQESLAAMRNDAHDIERQEKLLQLALTDNQTRLTIVERALAPLAQLWGVVKEWVEKINHWQHDPLSTIDAQDAERSTVELRAALGAAVRDLEERGDSRATPTRAGKLLQQEVKIFDEEQLPLLRLVCQPGMKDRHWSQIKKSTRLESLQITDTSNLLQMLDVGLQHYAGVIEETCVAAGHEHSLEVQLEHMEHAWTAVTLSAEAWRGFYKLCGADEVQQELDDQILRTQTIQGNKYIRPHAKRAAEWEAKLTKLQETIDELLGLEAAWLYLEPIFKAGEDVAFKLPSEAMLFDEMDMAWRGAIFSILEDPIIMNISEHTGTLKSLLQANAKLDLVRRGLAGYLDAKRHAFPRFNFVADAELLEILADTTDPVGVQPHLQKCFSGIAGLVFSQISGDDGFQIVAALDTTLQVAREATIAESQTAPQIQPSAEHSCERLDFAYVALNHKPIRPSTTSCDVERWLGEVEELSRYSLALIIEASTKETLSTDSRSILLRASRAQVWHEQVLIVVYRILWTRNIEAALRRAAAAAAEVEEARLLNARRLSGPSPSPDMLLDPHAALRALLAADQIQLEETICAVQNAGLDDNKYSASPRAQTSLSVLIIVDIYQRDVTSALLESHVCDVADFHWLVQFRYYLKSDSDTARVSPLGELETRCVHHSLLYAYEYLGGGGKHRLAITPLTLRCFRAFFCALRTHAGCILQGVPGAGSTATVLGLARALATHAISLNCTCSLGCEILAMLLRGASTSGSWMCMENFSSLPLEVISVAIAQIGGVALAARRGGMSVRQNHDTFVKGMTRTFVIECDTGRLDARSTSYVRELFRPISLNSPDHVAMGQALLCSHGVPETQANSLAKRLSKALHFCRESLSGRQPHYQFGLRLMNVIIVNIASTMKKRGCLGEEGAAESMHAPVDAIAVRALVDVIESGLAARDVDLFKEVLKLVFPGALVLECDPGEDFVMAFREACEKRNQLPLESFCMKVVHLHEAIHVWPGIALVGRPFSGKTSTWKNLITTLNLLKTSPGDMGATSLAVYTGALALSELYGTFDSINREWTDGILPGCYRQLSQCDARKLQRRHFLVLDGVVDASWTEPLQSALDESCTLCASNGELIRRSALLSVIFESENLHSATPAVVSRISVVSYTDNYMRWQVLYDSWIRLHDVRVEPTSSINAQNTDGGSNHDSTRGFNHDGNSDLRAFFLSEEECRLLEALSEWLVEPALAFLHHELHDVIAPMTDESLVRSLLRLLDGMLFHCLKGGAPGAGSADVKERRQRRQHIECTFLWALLWSVGASGPEASQMRFGVYLREVIADSRVIRARYPVVHEHLMQRGWCVPEFTGVFSGTLQLPLPAKGSAHDYEYRSRDNETGAWRTWQDALQSGGQYPAPEIGNTTAPSELLVPTVQTVQSGLLLDLMMRAGGHPALFCGPSGSGKTVHARAALGRLPRKHHRAAYLTLHATTSAQSFSHALLSRLIKRRKCVYGPPINQRAVVFIDDINLPDTVGLGKAQMPIELLRGLIETGSWYESPDANPNLKFVSGKEQAAYRDKQSVETRGQNNRRNGSPGKLTLQHVEDTSVWAATNGRAASNINARLLRHFTVIHTSDPNDTTLTRVYAVLIEAHFASQSFASDVVAATAALVAATIWTIREVVSNLRPTPTRQLCMYDARDSARCVQGVLRCRADDDFDKSGLARLWVHEVLRTFSDRLNLPDDQDWMIAHIQTAVLRNFKLDIDTLITEVHSIELPPKDPRGSQRLTSPNSTLSSSSGRTSSRSSTSGHVGARELQQLIFSDFHNPLERGVYLEVRDAAQLYDALERAQDDLFSSEPGLDNESDDALVGPVDDRARFAGLKCKNKRLVLFPLVVTHISRLVRAFSLLGGGHALLSGQTGTGRRAVVRLAAHVSGCELHEPRPYAQFDSLSSWHNELKLSLRRAGVGDSPVCLIIADTHILSLEEILANICDVISTGNTPGLFTIDERVEIAEEMRSRMRRHRGTKNAETMNHDDLFASFSERVRARLHISLILSFEVKSASRPQIARTLLRFPALLNHFTCVDHHAIWQDDALSAVAEDFLTSAIFVIGPDSKGPRIRLDISSHGKDASASASGARPESASDYADKRLQISAVTICRQIHTSVTCCHNTDSRMHASTSTFIELLECLHTNLDRARAKIVKMHGQYNRALDVARHAQRAISTIDDGIAAARAALDAANFEAVVFDTELSHKKSISGVESKYAEVEADAEALVHEEAAARVLAEEFEREIVRAQPAFDEAYAALEAVSLEELSELRALPRPPIGAKPIMEAVCVLLGEKPVKVADPADPTRRVLDFWGAAQLRVLAGDPAQLIFKLRSVDHDKIPAKAIAKLKDAYIGPGATHEAAFLDSEILDSFTGSNVSRGLCQWVRAANNYERISRAAQPKRDAAAHAGVELQRSHEALERKRTELDDVQAELANIAAGRDATRGRCDELQETILINSRRLERARSLLDSLQSGGELERWETLAREAETKAQSLVANALLSAGALTYLAPLDWSVRYMWLAEWAKSCQRRDLTVSSEWGFDERANDTLPQPAMVLASIVDETCIHEWQDVLSPLSWCPPDILAVEIEAVVESAVFAKHSLRWPLLLDPHGVALKWVCAAEKHLISLHGSVDHSKMCAAVETAAPMGTCVLIKDVCEKDFASASFVQLIPRRLEVAGTVDDSTTECTSGTLSKILVGPYPTKALDCHEQFRFYMTSQQQECHVADILWNGREQLVLVNFAQSHAALKQEMLQVVVSHEQASMHKEGTVLVQQDKRNNQRILQVENEILAVLTETSARDGSVLDNGVAIDRSHNLVKEVCHLREQQLEINRTKSDLYSSHTRYMPIAQSAQVFFCAISDLIHVEAAYAFSLRWFIDSILVGSLEANKSENYTGGEANLKKYVDRAVVHLAHAVYEKISRALLSKDRLLFALLLAVRPLLAQGAIGAVEWHFLLTGVADSAERNQDFSLRGANTTGPAAPQRVEEHHNPAKSWLPDAQWNELCSLSTIPAFAGLIEEFEAQIKMWKRVHDSLEPYTQPLPRHWDADLRGVNRLCILRCLRPDQIANAVRAFVQTQLGEEFLGAPKVDLGAIVAESMPSVPIVVTTAQKNRASVVRLIASVSSRFGCDVAHILLTADGAQAAQVAISKSRPHRSWVVIQNQQLCPEFTSYLELSFLGDDCNSTSNSNMNFRIWCVMDVNHVVTPNILQAATKFAYEAPSGVRSVVLDLYTKALDLNPDFLSSCSHGNEFRRLFFSLCICHAILLERIGFGSRVSSALYFSAIILRSESLSRRLGWNASYNFEPADLILSSDHLNFLLDNHEDNQYAAPFGAVKLCIGEYIYGGHILEEMDHRLLILILDRFCRSDVLRPGHALSSSGEFRMPLQDGTQASWLRTVGALPVAAPLEFLGLHESATIDKNNRETSELLIAVFLTENKHRSAHQESNPLESTIELIEGWASSLPTSLSQQTPNNTQGTGSIFINAVLVQEISKYEKLLAFALQSLSEVVSALQGRLTMNTYLDTMTQSIVSDNIPVSWERVSYLSSSGLSHYMHDLVQRCSFMTSWLTNGPPSIYWLSAFFSPQAFLLAIRMHHSCYRSMNVLSLEFDYKFLSSESPVHGTGSEPAKDGAYLRGVHFQCARWDIRREGLVECLPKTQFAPAPLIWFKPIEPVESSSSTALFACPLYRTTSRRSVFASDGQSSNFVTLISVPSPLPACHWVERGAAMFLQLDE